MKRLAVVMVFALALVVVPESKSCTTFTLQKKGKIVYGRNLDWHADSGLVCVNHRNVTKKALILQLQPRKTNPVSWTSKYGSVTFNSLGKEFPTGGMNEKGLVVDVMWLNETQYPKADSRPEVGVFQWTQYMLDTCRNTEEVLAAASRVRISEDGFPPQHYLVCDSEGKTAAIEFIKGEMVVRTGAGMPFTALANNTYDDSVKRASRCQGLGGQEPVPQSDDSLDRFTRVAAAVQSFSGSPRKMVDFSFDALHSVNAGYELNEHSTVWSIVYEVPARKIHFRTNGNRNVRSINLAKLDFSNDKPALVWPIVDNSKGDITKRAVPYTKELNREMIVRQVTNRGVIASVGDMSRMVDFVAAYPETCTAARP